MLTLRCMFLAFATIFVLWWRRPDQFTHPYIWVEDGTYVLKRFAEKGWCSIFEPIAGYYTLATRVISTAAFALSIENAPVVAVVGICAFTLAVVVAVAFSPTHLPFPMACALWVLLIPTNSEVFAVSEYAFWWAGILIILALLWRNERYVLQCVFLVLGGLSSPIIIPLMPVFWVRALTERQKGWVSAALVATACAVAQAEKIISSASLTGSRESVSISVAVGKYFGLFAFQGATDEVSVDLGIVVLLAFTSIIFYIKPPFLFWVLLSVLFSVIFITVIRIPITAIHPSLAGPRYFFYPSIITGWLLIWLAALIPLYLRIVIPTLLAFSVFQARESLTRRHERIDWAKHIQACAVAERYTIPVHLAGAEPYWYVTLTGAQCRHLLSRSWF